MPSSFSGHCLCGAVGFHAKGPSLWVAHCHCQRCQRAHGAAFVTWVGWTTAQVTWQDPQQALHWYLAEATGAERGFCRHCGSPMAFRSPRYPGELHLARALFDGPLDRPPESHAFHASHVDWVHVAEELPVDEDPPEQVG